MNSYLEGDLVSATINVTSAAGAAVNPTGVTLVVETPAGVKTTYNYGVGTMISFSSPATYSASIDTTGAPGVWNYKWVTAGAQAVAQQSFSVEATIL